MIVLAGGFLIAVLVALLVQASLSGGKKEPVVLQEEPKVQIIVASSDLKIGTELSDDNIKWQDWPKNAVFPGAVIKEGDKKPSEVISGRLRRAVKSGEPVVESALVPATEGNFMAASLGDGMRAYSIKVDAHGMVAGFVGPGDFVDVILTYRQSIRYDGADKAEVENLIEKNLNNIATETILQNIKVLAVDQTAVREEEDDKIKVGKTITLEVDYRGAEKLALAGQMGTLSLSLRRLGDDLVVTQKMPVTTDARVTNIYDEVIDEIAKAQDNAGQNSKIVRIYRGDQIQDVAVSP